MSTEEIETGDTKTNMEATPQRIDQDILGEKISSMLERNGSLSEKEWRQLMTYFVQDMRADIKNLMELPKDIGALRRTNIVLWFREHSTAKKIFISLGTITIGSIYALLILHAKDAIPIIIQVWNFIRQIT